MKNYSWPPFRFEQRRQLQQLIVAFFFFSLMGLSEYVGLWYPVRRIGEQLMAPLLRGAVVFEQGLEIPQRTVIAAYKATMRIQDLELRYGEALAQVSELQSLKAEHEALKQLIENTDRSSESVIVTAPIISQALPTIAAGADDGVEVGDVVLAARALVGRVERVSPKFATVSLLSQSGGLQVSAVTETGVTGLLRGDGKKIIMDELPSDAAIAVGQKVITAGQTGIKRDIFVGTIAKVMSEPSSPVQRAIVEQIVDFGQARVVEVLK